jgi:hypothetical protein
MRSQLRSPTGSSLSSWYCSIICCQTSKLASMVSAWCLQVGADKAYNILCTSTRQATCRSLSLSPQAVCVVCHAAAAHTAGVLCATHVSSRVDSLCRRAGADERTGNSADTRSLPAGCSPMKRVYVRDERVVNLSGFTASVDKHTQQEGYAPPTRLISGVLAEPARHRCHRCGCWLMTSGCWLVRMPVRTLSRHVEAPPIECERRLRSAVPCKLQNTCVSSWFAPDTAHI